MTDLIAEQIQMLVPYAKVWGFFLIFFFMTIESSFIPFPSEVVMIPAGFLAYRGELSFGIPWLDLSIALFAGLAGSLAGAYINYYLAKWLGRPFLHRYGRWFFLPEKSLNRAEEIFRQYGELVTFVCRLVPAIRQLISIPAGLSNMDVKRFGFFTALGAGVWCLVLIFIGWYFGHLSGDMTYVDMVHKGAVMIKDNYIWILPGLALIVVVYLVIHHQVMKPRKDSKA